MAGEVRFDAIDPQDEVVFAWFVVVVTSGFVAFIFDYEQIRWGSVILYYTFIINLATTYPKTKISSRNMKTLVTFGVVIVTLLLHAVLIHGLQLLALDLGAAQMVALAALANRGCVLLQEGASLDDVFDELDPITHPFISVGASTILLLGVLGLACRSMFGLFGVEVSITGSSFVFFLLLVAGATAGLSIHILEPLPEARDYEVEVQ